MLKRFAPIGLVLLAACGQSDLYTNVSEREANEMLVTLAEAGVEANKKPGAEDAFIVSAPRDDFAFAMQVLTAADFPRDTNDAMDDALRKKSMVSTQLEQRMRANAYLTEQINKSLSSIDGVQVARVHIVSPAKNALGEAVAEPTASVFIKHRASVDIASQTSSIKILVANAVEDLSYANVSVAPFPAAPVPRRAEPPVEQAAAELALPVLGGFGALALGVAAFRTLRRKPQVPQTEIAGPTGSAPSLDE